MNVSTKDVDFNASLAWSILTDNQDRSIKIGTLSIRHIESSRGQSLYFRIPFNEIGRQDVAVDPIRSSLHISHSEGAKIQKIKKDRHGIQFVLVPRTIFSRVPYGVINVMIIGHS